MTTSQVLGDALTLLDDGDGWTHNAFARNSDGDIVPVHHATAVTFCISGAIGRATGEEKLGREFQDAAAAILSQIKPNAPSPWNDEQGRTFSQVREVFNRAICSAELRESKARKAA